MDVRIIAVGLAAYGVVVAAAGGSKMLAAADPAPADLDGLLQRYFATDDPHRRGELVRQIEQAAGGSFDAVAAALQKHNAWAPLGAGAGRWTMDLPSGTVHAVYRVPDDYDPAIAWPVLICMPKAGQRGDACLVEAEAALADAVDQFIRIAVEKRLDGAFHLSPGQAGDFRRAVRTFRRFVHTDTDRVFLFGADGGGDAAWMTAIAHADLLAGVIVVSSYPQAPYPRQLYPMLLENLRHTPVLTAWPAADRAVTGRRDRLVDRHNQAILGMATRARLPVRGIDLAHVRGAAPTLPAEPVAALLSRRRTNLPEIVSHWFRYRAHGRAAWLRQARFAGNVWTQEQLAIRPAPETDHDAFITGVLRDRLAMLAGRVEGQTISVRTRRCDRVDLLLSPGLVDFDRPVTVEINGRRRFQGVVKQSIRTLLESACEDWDFQRPIAARLSFTVRSDGEND